MPMRGSIAWWRTSCRVMEATKAEGHTRLKLRTNPCCTLAEHGVRRRKERQVMVNQECVPPCFAAVMLLCFLVAAMHPLRDALFVACSCAAALQCLAAFPNKSTGQRSSPFLVQIMCNCHCPQNLVASIPCPLGPQSCGGPPQAGLGHTGLSKARTTCLCEMGCPVSPVEGAARGTARSCAGAEHVCALVRSGALSWGLWLSSAGP